MSRAEYFRANKPLGFYSREARSKREYVIRIKEDALTVINGVFPPPTNKRGPDLIFDGAQPMLGRYARLALWCSSMERRC